MLTGLLSGAVGSLLSGASSMVNSALSYGMNKKMAKYNAELQLKNQQTLMSDQYGYNMRSLQESPKVVRQGLVDAGFNPMLAVASATNAPTVGLGSAGMPSANGEYGVGDVGAAFDRAANSASQRKEQKKQIEKMDKLTDAELAKLHAESDAAMAHSGAAMYNAETNRLEAEARIEKIKKEADSINPRVERENSKYGSHVVGEVMRFVRALKDGSEVSTPSSAKGAAVMNDAAKAVQEERRKRVREGLANPRRKGRSGRR